MSPAHLLGRRGILSRPSAVASTTEDFTTATNPKSRFTVITDNVTFIVWASDKVRASDRAGPGYYTRRDAGWGAADDNAKVTARFAVQDWFHGSTKMWLGFTDRATNDRITVKVEAYGNGNAILSSQYGTVAGPTNTQYGPAVGDIPMVGATYYRLECLRNGNSFTVTLYEDDGVTVKRTGTLNLPAGAMQTQFGAGKALDPSFAVFGWDTWLDVDQMVLVP